eukprot:TRINITY_DN38846_c0_g1_i1.p2 TRINITY_DN38846_c0_g1~~TRINITY_DN38846_c0_g1_i1.p2  ORF type:complete len:526 (+),score=167.00 TRINITY_DN38846_c0_g1_i1:150-1727(+)
MDGGSLPPLSSRGHKPPAPTGAQTARTQHFLKQLEHVTEAFVCDDNASVEVVRRVLLQVRKQYDAVHHEAEQKEAQLRRLREDIRTLDALSGQKNDEAHKTHCACEALEAIFQQTRQQILETNTSRKVYVHMLARMQKEQAILRQKMLIMEAHLSRKDREKRQQVTEAGRSHGERVRCQQELDVMEADKDLEREARLSAKRAMEAELERRREANQNRADFEGWRHEVALEAANEAFNASAGRLRKLYAIEKLAGNCLQKTTFEQVERSNTTEDGFQRIREVTGLADVMDIVHKFLNREMEQEQLQGSVKDAEVHLEALRQDFEAFKRDTEGITFTAGEKSSAGASGGGIGEVYKDIELSERELNEAMEEHEVCRIKLQKQTLQVEHMKRWAVHVGQLLSPYDDPVKVETPSDLAKFFNRLKTTIEKFVVFVGEQIREHKITPKALVQVMTKEYNEQLRLLQNEAFLRNNCRVLASADARPASRQGATDDDPTVAFAEDRERCKKDAQDLALKKEAEQQKQKKVRA